MNWASRYTAVGRHSAEIRQMLRFIASGLTATAGNLIAVWVVRQTSSLEVALGAGIAVGMTISFLLTKIFAFRARSWSRTPVELMRFLLVYGLGVGIYWSIALAAGRYLLPSFVSVRAAALGGAALGAGAMMVTSYLGHRFFTYRVDPMPSSASVEKDLHP